MPVFNRENALALLKGMLAAQTRPAIHFIRGEETLAPKQFKHTYRFFVINRDNIFNVSGIITAAFGVTVNDRSQAFSINSLTSEEDLKQFSDAIRRFTELPVTFVDLLTGAADVLEIIISAQVEEFFTETRGQYLGRLTAPEPENNHEQQ